MVEYFLNELEQVASMLTKYIFIKQVEINCVYYQSNTNDTLSKLHESCCINPIDKQTVLRLKSFDMIIKLVWLKLMSIISLSFLMINVNNKKMINNKLLLENLNDHDLTIKVDIL